MKKLVFLVSFLLLSAGSAYAQDAADNVAGRIGIGFSMVSSQGVLNNDIPTITGRYWFDRNVAGELFAGFATGDDEDSFIVGGKAIAILQSFKSLNIYAAVSGAFGSVEYGDSGNNGFFKVAAGAGVEWFVLENLSISTEVGVGFFDAANISKQFGVYADWLPQLGIRYYL